MFNNKKDVLLESVKKIMQESELHRKLEAELNEAYGIASRAALPHEYVAEYDAMLAEAKKNLSHDQSKLAALGTVAMGKGSKNKIDKHDLDAARKGHAHKVGLEEKVNPVSNMVSSVKNKLGMGSKNPFDATLGSNSARERMINRSNPLARENQPTMVGRAVKSVKNKLGMGSKNPFDAPLKEESLEEKAVSKAQHRFMGLVRAIQKGEAHGSAKAEKAAKEMSVKQVRDYAKTKEKGLPEKK